ncbi:MAG: enoyl-CoA hydratase [Ignavibacteriales bacterium]
MKFETILFSSENHIAKITINRPDKLNALNATVIKELSEVFDFLAKDDSSRVVVITGSGPKAFVAGADISEINKLNTISGKSFAELGQEVFTKIEKLTKPVIAMVNGFALGGGSELAWACHLRFASSNAKFGQPEINLGIIPGYGGTQRLPRLLNQGYGYYYILTGENIDADTALKLGLVQGVFSPEELEAAVMKVALTIASKPADIVSFAMKAVHASGDFGLKEGLAFEATLFALCCGTANFKEGTTAFLEKRKPEFNK